jgi:small-conductance mechanosensitive channel
MFSQLQVLLAQNFFGVPVSELATGAGVFVVALLLFYVFRTVVITRLKKLALRTQTDLDDTLVDLVAIIPAWLYFLLALYAGASFWPLPTELEKLFGTLVTLLVILQSIRILQSFLGYLLEHWWGRTETECEANATAIQGVKILSGIILWSAGILFALDSFGFQITTLIAGLGVGGIAVAFALQNILGDLFSSFAIYFDRPFNVGDFIIVGPHSGTVKRIGLKTTRLTALQGEEIVIANQELTNSRIQNFRKLRKRRVSFGIGVVYGTSPAQLKKIPDLVQKVMQKIEKAEFDRCHFKEFGDFSLNFEVVYFAGTGDYAEYLDTRQAINLGILEAFNKEKIEMAFPTQTVHLAK